MQVGSEADTPIGPHAKHAQAVQAGEGPGERGNVAVAVDAPIGAQESTGEGYPPQAGWDPVGLREQEISGEAQPMPRWDRAQESGECC